MKAYRVKGWAAIYENNRSRTVKELRWVPVPNKFDGEGFKRVMQHDRASDIFAAFILILQVASRCQPRGTLIRDGRPHDAASLALKTGGRREWFEIALEVLSSPEIGWLEVFEAPDSQVIARDCHRPVSQPAADCHRPVSQVTMNGREGNGTTTKLTRGDKALVGEKSELATRLETALASQWVNDAGKWINRIKNQTAKARRVIAEVERAIKEGGITTTPAQFAEDTWKRFK